MTKQEQIDELKKQVQELQDRPLERQVKKATEDIELLCTMVEALLARGEFPDDEKLYNQTKVYEFKTRWMI